MDDARKELDELSALAKPLADYLRQKHHPHTVIVVADDRVVLVEETMGVLFD